MNYLALAPVETGWRPAGACAYPSFGAFAGLQPATSSPHRHWHEACVPVSVTPSPGERLP